jgi:hypothetical protein
VVRALETWAQTRDEGGRVGRRERLAATRTPGRAPRCWYTLSNAAAEVALATPAEAHGRRPDAEGLFAAGKGEVGPGHYEVRSWVGWHHHMTLSLLALWFLQRERNRSGGKAPAMAVPQTQEVFARLLLPNPPSAARSAEEVGGGLRRNEEARIYHWYAEAQAFPPPRTRPSG